jgi:hypothetical protein
VVDSGAVGFVGLECLFVLCFNVVLHVVGLGWLDWCYFGMF